MDKLEPGTRIQFSKTITDTMFDNSPKLLYAHIGDYGTVIKDGAIGGYWVRTDHCPSLFVASRTEFKIITD